MTAMTYAELKRRKKPIERSVKIYEDDDVVRRFTEANNELGRLEMRGDKVAEEQLKLARAKRDKLAAELETKTITMVFRSVGRQRFEELAAEHPPTDEDHKEARRQMRLARPKLPDEVIESVEADFCFESFAPVIVAESSHDPKLTLKEVEELFREWNDQEIVLLYQAALEVNTVRRVVDWGN